jgi:glycosyltransferase involved in cell wall biosynthesis
MRVLFDDQIFSHQTRGGISNYFVSLATQFEQDSHFGVKLEGFPIYTKNAYLKEAGMGLSLPGTRFNRAPILSLSNRLVAGLRKVQRSPAPDIVHHTYYFEKPWRTHPGSRHVVTIHDMIPELFPAHFPSGNPHAQKREHILAADAIACVSESTKQDLMSMYPDLSVPVVVTPLGVSEAFHPGSGMGAEHGGYFLFVGGRGGYKNFQLLLESFTRIAEVSKADLLLVGGGPIQAVEANHIQQLGLEDRIRQQTPTNHELVELYRNAICLVFPSKYEGFGLPTLEAMASGCPTLLSETPALIEVGGDAAEYFPADDPDYLAAKMVEMEVNAALRHATRNRGLERASLFAWSRTATNTRDCYLAALSS